MKPIILPEGLMATPGVVSQIWGIRPYWLRRLILRGWVRKARIGGRLVVRIDDVHRMAVGRGRRP